MGICVTGIMEKFAYEMTKKDVEIERLRKLIIEDHRDNDGIGCDADGRHPCAKCDEFKGRK